MITNDHAIASAIIEFLNFCYKNWKTKATNDGKDHITSSRKQRQGDGFAMPITIGSIISRSPKSQKGYWIFYLVSST